MEQILPVILSLAVSLFVVNELPDTLFTVQLGGDATMTQVNELIASNTDINIPDAARDALLFSLAKKGHIEGINALITAGADVNIQNDENETALFSASLRGHLGVVNVLITAGADVNHKTSENETALL
jgi:ankyrin repeat protein